MDGGDGGGGRRRSGLMEGREEVESRSERERERWRRSIAMESNGMEREGGREVAASDGGGFVMKARKRR